MSEIACPFCQPPPGLGGFTKIAFLPTDLCAEHLEASGVPEFERRHPIVDGERRCTPECGCVSAEDALRCLDA